MFIDRGLWHLLNCLLFRYQSRALFPLVAHRGELSPRSKIKSWLWNGSRRALLGKTGPLRKDAASQNVQVFRWAVPALEDGAVCRGARECAGPHSSMGPERAVQPLSEEQGTGAYPPHQMSLSHLKPIKKRHHRTGYSGTPCIRPFSEPVTRSTGDGPLTHFPQDLAQRDLPS